MHPNRYRHSRKYDYTKLIDVFKASIKNNILILLILIMGSCQAQNEQTMKSKIDPLLCDPIDGVCETPDTLGGKTISLEASSKKPIKIVYYTDPICSSCWGVEPQLRKLKMEYGDIIDIEYHMGGLLPDWSYNSGGISKPSDVAHHWDEVSAHYNMPINGDVWLEDPLDSSYPPSIAFKAAQLQDEKKAIDFMRLLRERVFLEKVNITKWEAISDAAQKTGLDVIMLKSHYDNQAKTLFQADLDKGRQLGVRGFPTFLMSNADGANETVYGFKPYPVFENAIKKLYPQAKKKEYSKSWNDLFGRYQTLTSREFSELSGRSDESSNTELSKLFEEKKVNKLETKNGPLWIRLDAVR